MPFNLAAIVRRTQPGIRRKTIILRDIPPPTVMAGDLYRAVYAPVIEAWQRASERIVAEYARSISEITTDSPIDLESIIGETDTETRRLVLMLTPRLRDWAWRVESFVRRRFRGAILSAVGIDLATILGPETARQTVETFIARNVALVKSVSDQARSRISDTVFRGLTARSPVADVAREIADAIGMGRRRARGMASDQLSKLSAALASGRRREAGLDTYEYKHSGKLHPRPEHKARDGNLYSENPDRVGTNVNGKTVRAASDIPPDDRASIPPWCGCRELSVLILE
jgi:hypothetical protein